MPAWFFLAMIAGPIVLVFTVLAIVFSAVKRAIARDAAALAEEGIERDSGPVTITTRMKSFRSARISASSRIGKNPGRVILTKQKLHVMQRPQRYGIFERGELPRFTVRFEDGRVRLRSDEPPRASGTVEYAFSSADGDAWVTSLIAAGATAPAR